MPRAPTYIIYGPGYSADNGGSMFMHQLVDALRGLDEHALLWPMAPLAAPLSWRRKLQQSVTRQEFLCAPHLDTPVATKRDLGDDAIVVYPELVPANPLGVANVVRWLLYKPGLRHPFEFGADDLFFATSDFSDDVALTGGAQPLFLPSYNPVYRDNALPERSGSCYLLRKGAHKPMVHDLENSRQIDGLSHEEIAAIFNQCEYFYSYDEATMYSQYAALCGCVSIVIPELYQSRTDWARQRPISRYGIAYGLDDIRHARATMHQVADLLQERRQLGLQSVRDFVKTTKAHFGFAAGA